VARGMAHPAEEAPTFEVSGHLKWFNYVKGYGFVTTHDGRDVFLHFSCLRRAGMTFIEEGSEVWCDVVDSGRGLQAQVLTQVRPAQQPTGDLQYQNRGTHAAPQMGGAPVTFVGPVITATVKWFNKTRGYGFLTAEGASSDIFLHIEVMRRCGLATVDPDQRVRISLEDGDKGLSATAVELLSD